MSYDDKIEFTKENIDSYLKAVAKEYRKAIGKGMPAEMILIAMKLKSGRLYKNDISDIMGILMEHKRKVPKDRG